LSAAAYATADGRSSRWPAGSAEAALQRACPAGERRICGRRATAPSTSPQALLRAAGMLETLRSAWREALLRAAAYATAAGSVARGRPVAPRRHCSVFVRQERGASEGGGLRDGGRQRPRYAVGAGRVGRRAAARRGGAAARRGGRRVVGVVQLHRRLPRIHGR
jgi:hypothetical protein